MVVAFKKASSTHREPKLSFTEGGLRGVGECVLKRNVFSEELAISYP